MKDIYLDCNATTSVLPAAVTAASAAMAQGYGNPSSTHATGLQAKAMMDGVRARARRLPLRGCAGGHRRGRPLQGAAAQRQHDTGSQGALNGASNSRHAGPSACR